MMAANIWFERFSVCLALFLFFTDGLAVYIIGPIFPTEAGKKNVDQSSVGLICSCAQISELITSLLMIVIANPQNQKFFVIAGRVATFRVECGVEIGKQFFIIFWILV